MKLRNMLIPVCLGFAVVTMAPPALYAADDQGDAKSDPKQEKPKGGAMKGAAAGAAVGKLSGGSATKGAAIGGTAGAVEKHHSKKKIEKEGHD